LNGDPGWIRTSDLQLRRLKRNAKPAKISVAKAPISSILLRPVSPALGVLEAEGRAAPDSTAAVLDLSDERARRRSGE
jgi:hypothetical protein